MYISSVTLLNMIWASTRSLSWWHPQSTNLDYRLPLACGFCANCYHVRFLGLGHCAVSFVCRARRTPLSIWAQRSTTSKKYVGTKTLIRLSNANGSKHNVWQKPRNLVGEHLVLVLRGTINFCMKSRTTMCTVSIKGDIDVPSKATRFWLTCCHAGQYLNVLTCPTKLCLYFEVLLARIATICLYCMWCFLCIGHCGDARPSRT